MWFILLHYMMRSSRNFIIVFHLIKFQFNIRSLYFIQLCFSHIYHSARQAYENCINRQARYKCRNDSASFVTTIAKILSTDKRLNNCDKVEKLFCSSAKSLQETRTFKRIFQIVVTIQFVFVSRMFLY